MFGHGERPSASAASIVVARPRKYLGKFGQYANTNRNEYIPPLGAVRNATPTGREDAIGGLPTYIVQSNDKSKSKSVVFLVDIVGGKFKNVPLLANDYAKAEFYCSIPDIHGGDSLPIDFPQSIEPPLKVNEEEGMLDKAKDPVDFMLDAGPLGRSSTWLYQHGAQDPWYRQIGALGFCSGGHYAILQGHGRKGGEIGSIDAAYACHPLLLSIASDLNPVTKPTSAAVGEKDSLPDLKSMEQIREGLEKPGVPTEVKIYQDQVHGFALRSD
ncbi:uncharacterized protein Z518_07003 [Rhinocladiella mackenziei CBS 650.93]|uniref:Dienelactone hydrolase domain-containing protein n=1 Tax=Rhinocladiella mackenziei CBS 650.93 TaxID=1442369 RepID=A0A0D2IJM3_9EURO|nr:uncharacterized protein Z518_07003 [Rhinocladiella mackenziei CBS 650.93]KIX03451.1 hypothetical protein Z518_07003 [Rhinocladiella mackenziei CBS 650.93]